MKWAIIAFPLVVDADVVFAYTMDYILYGGPEGSHMQIKNVAAN